MGLQPTFTMAEFKADFDRRLARIKGAQIERMLYLGEICLKQARYNHTYTDRTGNLTSSMGYVLVDGSRVIRNAGGSNDLKAKLATQSHEGQLTLFVVAGMEYAKYVEAKGYDVLTSSELLAERELPRMLKDLQANINKMR